MELTLGFSPCPNDTFIFDAMVQGHIDTHGITFKYQMEDVETLNQMAESEVLDITKLSYSAFLYQANRYSLLHSGSALGKGVGPLLIAKTPFEITNGSLADKKIAIPGAKTTANLLLSVAFPEAKDKTPVVFSEIEEAVLRGEYEAGLVIHENRFTYAAKGLHKLLDLGDWWEHTTGAAIPLGGIVIRRSLDPQLKATVDSIIKRSIQWSWQRYPDLSPFITENAQEMEEEVMRKHIELYVNEYSEDLGDAGRRAINTLFEMAKSNQLITGELPETLFY